MRLVFSRVTVREPGRVSGDQRDADVVPCVGAVIVDTAGRLLLIRRAHAPAAGRWSLPGGRVEAGETAERAVVREVAEETGLAVTVGVEVGVVRRPTADGREYVIRDFRAEPVGGTLRAGDDAADARWCDAAAYAALDDADELVPGLTDALRAWSCLPD